MFAGGMWLILSAELDRRRVLANRQRLAESGATPAAGTASASLASLGAIMPPIIYGFLVIGGLISSVEFFALDHGKHFGLPDLGGFLFLLAAYGFSVSRRARLRLPAAWERRAG
jgi:hypothetical protein